MTSALALQSQHRNETRSRDVISPLRRYCPIRPQTRTHQDTRPAIALLGSQKIGSPPSTTLQQRSARSRVANHSQQEGSPRGQQTGANRLREQDAGPRCRWHPYCQAHYGVQPRTLVHTLVACNRMHVHTRPMHPIGLGMQTSGRLAGEPMHCICRHVPWVHTCQVSICEGIACHFMHICLHHMPGQICTAFRSYTYTASLSPYHPSKAPISRGHSPPMPYQQCVGLFHRKPPPDTSSVLPHSPASPSPTASLSWLPRWWL